MSVCAGMEIDEGDETGSYDGGYGDREEAFSLHDVNGGDVEGGGALSGLPGAAPDGAVPKEKRITTRFMTKYERARVLGTRALQIRWWHFISFGGMSFFGGGMSVGGWAHVFFFLSVGVELSSFVEKQGERKCISPSLESLLLCL